MKAGAPPATPGDRQAWQERDRWIAAAIFALALALRLLFLFSTPGRSWPHSPFYEGDAPTWVAWARALAAGRPFEFDLPLRAPGVAYLLAWLQRWLPGGLDGPFLASKVLWCALSAATCLALYRVAARWLSRRVGLLATGFLTFSFGSYLLATSLDNEAPYALLVVLLVGSTLAWRRRPTAARSLGLGALHGGAMLLRPEHALLLVAMTAMGLGRPPTSSAGSATSAKPVRSPGTAGSGVTKRRNKAEKGPPRWWRWAAPALLVGAAALATLLPWMLRSHAAAVRFNTEGPEPDFARTRPPWTSAARAYLDRLPAFAREGNFAYLEYEARLAGARVVDEGDVRRLFEGEWGYVPEPIPTWTLVSSKGGLDFALANHPASGGGFSRAALSDHLGKDPELALGRPSHLRLFNHGWAVGWSFIRADPAGWLRLVGAKLGHFAAGATLGLGARDLPYGPGGVRRPVDLLVPSRGRGLLWRGVLLALFLAGSVVAVRSAAGAIWVLVAGYKLVVTILFYGYARQAASILPAFAVLAALAVDALLRRLEKRRPALRRAAATLGLAAVAALVGVDAYQAIRPVSWEVRPAGAATRIEPAPEWGADAFISYGEILLRPAASAGSEAPPGGFRLR